MTKVILIDIDNTLLDFNKSAQRAIELAGDELGISFEMDIYSIYKRINSILWQALERGEISMDRIFAIRWNIIFEEAGIYYDGETFEACYRKNLYDSAVPIDGARELLEYLSDKYVVCAASNGVWAQQVNRLKNAELSSYLRAVYTSDIMGAQKPTRTFFRECLKKASLLLPEDKLPIWHGESVMIGDSLTADINGIREYGVEPIWFNFENSDSEPEDKECKVVYNLLEIRDIL